VPPISVQRRSSGDPEAARSYLAAAVPHAERIGHRQIGPLELARSLDCEYSGAPQEALAALTAAFASHTQDLGEIEDLLGGAVRLAIQAGDHETAKALTGHADALATGSDIAHRQANALYCHALLNLDAPRLLIAAERYGTAGRPCGRPCRWKQPPGISPTPAKKPGREPRSPPPRTFTPR
jgi:hypothetical protein